jgi:hypothetical protein
MIYTIILPTIKIVSYISTVYIYYDIYYVIFTTTS